jgi:hypothetical protein
MKAPNRKNASGYISSLFTYTNAFNRNAPKAGVQKRNMIGFVIINWTLIQ